MPPKRTRPNRYRRGKNTAVDENRIHPPCSFSSRLKSFQKVHMFNDEPITYQTHAPLSLISAGLRQSDKEKSPSRSESTKHAQSNVVQLYSPQWLAQLGFYYTPISIKHKFAITCAYCNTLIQDPVPAEADICDIHLSQNSSCPLSLIWKFRNMKESTDYTIWRKDPYFGDVNNNLGVNIRKETFKYWKYTYPDIDQMVSSGLYYDPLNDKDENIGDDRVVCMYCGLNLEQWEENDDPVEAHKQSNPKCWVFNYQDSIDDVETVKPTGSPNVVQDDEIPNFEPYEENPFSDIEDNHNNGDLNETEENRHSIESVTTTTTTNVMPIEIVDKDEVEEYLSNSQQFSEKMIEIPSIKSSELSQYFTELDAGSEYDLGASYFAINKKKRDKEREEREQIMNNVETISEEVEVDKSVENNEEVVQNNPSTEVIQDENELYENYQFDDFEIPDHDQNRDQRTDTNEEIVKAVNSSIIDEPNGTTAIPQDSLSTDKQVQVDDSQHNISTSYLASGVNIEVKPLENENVAHDEVSDTIEQNREETNLQEKAVIDQPDQQGIDDVTEGNDVHNVISNLEDKAQDKAVIEDKEKDENEVAEQRKKKEEEERQKEIDRVEKLEAELKFLKEQIAALQKSQQNTVKEDRVADEITPISINESNIATEEVQVKIEDVCQSEAVIIKKEKMEVEKKEVAKKKSKGKKKKKLKRMHDDENLLIRKSKKAKTVITEDDDKMDIDVPVTENDESVAKQVEKEPEVKMEEVNDDARSLRHSSSSAIEPISLFRSDIDNVVETTSNSKNNSANPESPAKVKGMENYSSEVVKEMKENKDEESFEIRHEEKADIMITPIQHLDNSPIKVPLSSPVKQPKESHKETIFSVPSFGKSINEANESEIPTQADESRPTFDKTDFPETGKVEDNEHYHPQESPVQVYGPHDTNQGNTKDDIDNTSPTLLRKNARSTPEEEETADLKDLIKNDIRGKPLVLSPKDDKSNGEINTTEKLFLGSDFLMDNQSTPHLAKVEDFLKDTTKANYDATPKISPPVLSHKAKEWQPLDGKKYLEFLRDIKEATSYVKEVIDSPYELLGEDMDGLLTEFVAEIPPDQLRMTIRERLKFQEDLAVRLVLDKADEMLDLFRKDQQRALQFLENLPEE